MQCHRISRLIQIQSIGISDTTSVRLKVNLHSLTLSGLSEQIERTEGYAAGDFQEILAKVADFRSLEIRETYANTPQIAGISRKY